MAHHAHPIDDSPRFNGFLWGAWLLAFSIVATALLGFNHLIDEHLVLAAVVFLGVPAFVLMLFADKE